MPAADLLERLQAHEVPVGLINRAPDLLPIPHIAARDMIVRLAAGFDQDVPMAGVVPKLSRTPGRDPPPRPALGAHTEAVLREVAGCHADGDRGATRRRRDRSEAVEELDLRLLASTPRARSPRAGAALRGLSSSVERRRSSCRTRP